MQRIDPKGKTVVTQSVLGKRSRFSAIPYIFWILLFTIIPFVLVIGYAFTDPVTRAATFTNVVKASESLPVLIRSLALAFIATLICLVVGYPIAYIMSRKSAAVQRAFMMLIMLPMWMNFLLRTYAWMTILEDNGIINNCLRFLGLPSVQLINTSGAVILGMVYNYLPFMILPLFSIMTKIDTRVIEAAQDLGCNPMQVISKVIVPLSFPGIATGTTMTFVPCVSTFIISRLLGGSDCFLIGDLIEERFKLRGDGFHVGSAMSLVLMIVVLICMGILNRFDSDEMEDSIR